MADRDYVYSLLTAGESGTEVAQDIDLWDKLRKNHDLLSVFMSHHGPGVGSHFMGATKPWFLRENLGSGAWVIYGYNNKHQALLITGTSSGQNAVLDATDVLNADHPGASFITGPTFGDMILDFRFSLNVNFVDNNFFIGLADGNPLTGLPTNYVALMKDGVAGDMKFKMVGFGGAGSESTPFSVSNNDDGVTHLSGRIAYRGGAGSRGFETWLASSSTGPLIARFIATDTIAANTRVRPVFRAETTTATIGSLLLDGFMLRPNEIGEL